MRLLLLHSSPPHSRTWPLLADEQIECGPRLLDRNLQGRIFSLRTPPGDYDLAAVLASLPTEQQPDVVACHVDGLTDSWPGNLAAIPKPRLLLVGDTQLAEGGLPRVLEYARRESFDRIVLTQGCLDEAVFHAYGLTKTTWQPGLLCSVYDPWLPLVRQTDRQPLILVPTPAWAPGDDPGQGIETLHRLRLPLRYWTDHAENRLEQMGRALCTLVPASQGQWPDQLFEALAAGSFVVATGLGPEAAALQASAQGVPFLALDSADELGAKLADLLLNPASARPQAQAGADWYQRHLSLPARRAVLAALADPAWEAPGPVRPNSIWCRLDPTTLAQTLAASSIVQTLLRHEAMPALAPAREHPDISQALAERFPRLQLSPEAALRWNPESLNLALEPQTAELCRLRTGAWSALHAGNYPVALDTANQLAALRAGALDGMLLQAELSALEKNTAGYKKYSQQALRLNPCDPRIQHFLVRVRKSSLAQPHWQAELAWRSGLVPGGSMPALAELAAKHPDCTSLQLLHAQLASVAGAREPALESWYRVARYHPNEDEHWFQLGLALWEAGRRAEAGFCLRRATDHSPQVEAYQSAFRLALLAEPSIPVYAGKERNLVSSSCENCQKHGAGVLIKRFFGSQLDAITLRPATFYGGVEEAGGTHFCVPTEDLTDRELEVRLRRLLAPYQVRRIMLVPFTRDECILALAAHTVTGAKLCTYVMDDRNILIAGLEDTLIKELLRRSQLRLAISSELQMAYMMKYNYDFEVMPPIVLNRAAQRRNHWNAKIRPPTNGALVGSMWTNQQLQQLLHFVGHAGLTLDWFGLPPAPEYSAPGINVMGLVPEQVLADRLTEYPFVVVPSGTLNGSEDNEWLTRLSLPSRIVFILQTQTPVLVLGSKHTCAGRHVAHLGIGRVASYQDPHAARTVRDFTTYENRSRCMTNAARAADDFVMPESGSWIWRSLDSGVAQPAPFHAMMGLRPELEVVWPPESAGMIPISHTRA